jgi:hypothetical protein
MHYPPERRNEGSEADGDQLLREIPLYGLDLLYLLIVAGDGLMCHICHRTAFVYDQVINGLLLFHFTSF